jgi:hypothetical protein
MLEGEIRREVRELRREVLCLRASLSEQDLESVGGASGRDGLRRTMPRAEKYPRPWSSGWVVASEGREV